MTHLQDTAAFAAPVTGARPRLSHDVQAPIWQMRPAFLAGRGNRVEAPGRGGLVVKLATSFWGASSDNLVRVGQGFRTRQLGIRVAGANNRIEIGDDVRFDGTISVRGFGLTVRIGDRCDIKKTHLIACDAGAEIGRDCLVATGVIIRTSDMHAIVDRASGQRINAAQDVVVGNDVWLGAETVLLKGARVPDGCVVGLRSTVTRGFDEPDCVLVGTPARIVRRGIAWSR